MSDQIKKLAEDYGLSLEVEDYYGDCFYRLKKKNAVVDIQISKDPPDSNCFFSVSIGDPLEIVDAGHTNHISKIIEDIKDHLEHTIPSMELTIKSRKATLSTLNKPQPSKAK